MKNTRCRSFISGLTLLLGLVAVNTIHSAPPAKPATDAELCELKLSSDARLVGNLDQILHGLRAHVAPEPWDPQVNQEVARGGADLYAKVAPAVVVVRTDSGHGTGFVVDPAGWIVTNHHVIEDAPIDPTNGAQVATIHWGRLQDDLMKLVDKGSPAHVYKDDPKKDLALLKLVHLPDGVEHLPTVKLAKRVPRPGSTCVAIGHPASAMLWTVRTGIVSGVGIWPREMIDFVILRLALTDPKDRRRLHDRLAVEPPRKVLISNCGINPGDSGGPLVDEEGRLIAVTFAIPAADRRNTASAAKFAYHIHLDEVKKFLAQRPNKPPVFVPDPLPPGMLGDVKDLDKDGLPDTLLFGTKRDGRLSGMLVDLDQNSIKRLKTAKLDTDQLIHNWDFEFALHFQPRRQAFYDTNDDGQIDLVLLDTDGNSHADGQLRLVGGTWKHSVPRKQVLLDPSLIKNPDHRKRLAAIFPRS